MNRYAEGVLGHATRLFVEGHLAECLAALEFASEELEDHGRAWQLRGLAEFQLGDINNARRSLEHASILIPLSPLAQCRLAECYLRIRQQEAAAAILIHLAELEMLTEFETVFVAEGLIRVGEFEHGLQYCLDGIRRYRGSAELLFTASQVMRRLGYQPDATIPFASLAHRLRPAELRYRIAYARLLAAADRRQEAAELLARIDLEALSCVASLQRLRLLFETLGEHERLDQCAARLEQIHYEVVSDYRPPDSR